MKLEACDQLPVAMSLTMLLNYLILKGTPSPDWQIHQYICFFYQSYLQPQLSQANEVAADFQKKASLTPVLPKRYI